jgi:predicted outer membrane repeat protein
MLTTTTTRAALLALAATTLASADTITVGPSLTDFDYITITAAIANANSGDEILIAPGLYAENLDVIDKDLALRNAGGGTVTVFGQGLDKCFRSTGTSTDVVLEGLTFTNGFSTTAGAGVSIEGGSRADIIDCIIENNEATTIGGGLYMSGGGTVTNTIIRNNTSASDGGGVDLRGTLPKVFTNVTIEGNTGVNGGGLSYSTNADIADFIRCTFRNNTATVRGGAIAVLGNANTGIVDVEDCVFEFNDAATGGGAVWVSDLDVFRAVNSIFRENTAGVDGGAIRNEEVTQAVNCTFYNNNVTSDGPADTFHSDRIDATTALLNCIVVNQSATSEDGPGALSATYSLLPEGPMGAPNASGNFNANPMFVDAMTGDFTLMPGSPAIDAGNSRGAFTWINVLDINADLAANVRNLDDPDTANTGVSTWDLCIDLGAYEFQPDGTACRVDFTGDGELDFFDVSAFLQEFQMGCE